MLNHQLLIKIAETYSTPCYVYDKQKIVNNYYHYDTSFAQNCPDKSRYLICYAVKANSNLALLNTLSSIGAGFDIVSLGELKRVLKAGGQSNKVIFSGVGKQDFEIKTALEAGILCFNIESEQELILINQIARALKKKAPISIRVNPNIDAQSHPYISTGLKEHKFGIALDGALNIYQLAQQLHHIKIIGVDCHIGSQLTDLRPLQQACQAMGSFIQLLKSYKIHIEHINMGGGLGIAYHPSQKLPSHRQWVETIVKEFQSYLDLQHFTLIIEPGRSIVGDSGLLLTKVIYHKQDKDNQHNFIIVDAGMNDLMRPALYQAQHAIINLHQDVNNLTAHKNIHIVGPVCESSDIFLKNVNLTANPGDILAIKDTGAYGFCMSSNYNSRPRACEVLLDNNNYYLIRPRETIEDLYQNEIILY